jgi:hypothetical protein
VRFVFDERMISRLNASLAVLGLLLFGHHAMAGPPQAVVELFTSQGCSSCPPADAVLVEMAKRSDVIALTFPVDYWDYLGWKDTLAHPLFTARQRGYAHGRGDRQVYTPQVVVNGVKDCVGSDRAAIEAVLNSAKVRAAAFSAVVNASERNGMAIIEVEGAADRSAEIWALPVTRIQTVSIERGENRGRAVTYANVVRGLVRVGDWTGGSARFETPLRTVRGDADGFVVLLQTLHGKKPGPIVGAAKSPGL